MAAAICPKCGKRFPASHLSPGQVFNCQCGATVRVPDYAGRRPRRAERSQDLGSTPLGFDDQLSFDRAFAKVAVERGFVTDKQVTESLEAQKLMAQVDVVKSLDQVMVDKELITIYQAKRLAMLAREGGRITEIGGFRITGKLGKGGMGTVFRAHQISLDRDVALKVLPRQLAENESYLERFLREARSAAKLNHPNIVQAIDVGEDRGYYYFAMELVDGESLRSILKRQGKLPIGQACRITMSIAEALDYAWQEQRIIHRDVKPDNILINKRGQAKLADLGLVKSALMESGITLSGAVIGTPNFISPEQVETEGEVDARSDMYSLGCTLYNMLTGDVPYRGDSPAAVFLKHVTQPPPDPSSITPEVPLQLTQIVQRMMAKKREDRYMSLGEVASVLESFLEEWQAQSGEQWLRISVSDGEEDTAKQPTMLVSGASISTAEIEDGEEPGLSTSDSMPPPIPVITSPGGAGGAADASAWRRIKAFARGNPGIVIGSCFLLLLAVAAVSILALQNARYRRLARGDGGQKTGAEEGAEGGAEPEESAAGTGGLDPVAVSTDPLEPDPSTVTVSAEKKDLPSPFDEDAEVVSQKEFTSAQAAAMQLMQGRTTWFDDGSLEVMYDFSGARQYEDFGLFTTEFPAGGGLRIPAGSRYELAGRRPEGYPECHARWMPGRALAVTLKVLRPEGLRFRVELESRDEKALAVEVGPKEAMIRYSGVRPVRQAVTLPNTKEVLLKVISNGEGRLYVSANGYVVALDGGFLAPLRVRIAAEGEAESEAATVEGAAAAVVSSFALRGMPASEWLSEGMKALGLEPDEPEVTAAGKLSFITLRKDGQGDFSSLADAVGRAADGAVIEVADMGPYKIEEGLVIPAGLTIRGGAEVMPLIEITGAVEPALKLGSRCTVSGLFFRTVAREGSTNPAVGVLIEDARNVTIRGCAFVSGANGSPLRLKGRASGVKIEDSLFVGWPFGKGRAESTGVTTYDWSGRGLKIDHCTFWGEAKWNAVVTHFNRPEPARVDITNSIISVDTDVEFGGVGRWEHNCYTPGTPIATALKVSGEEQRLKRRGRKNFIAWPDFRMPFNMDFALHSGSPCRGTAAGGRDVGVAWPNKRWTTFYSAAGLAHLRKAGFGVVLPLQEKVDLLARNQRDAWRGDRGEFATTINGLEFGPDPRCYWFRAVREWKLILEWTCTEAGTLALCTPPDAEDAPVQVSTDATGRITVRAGQKTVELPTGDALQQVQKLEASLQGSTLSWSLNDVAMPEADLRLHPSQVPFLFDFKGKVLIKRAEIRLSAFAPRMLTHYESEEGGGDAVVAKVRLTSQQLKPSGERIFDGETLEGWRTFGGNWSVADKTIVGRGEKGDGGHYLLIYQKSFLPKSEFKLWYSFKADEGASGDLYFKGYVFSLARLTQGEIRVMPVKKVSYLSAEIAAESDKSAVRVPVRGKFAAGRWAHVLAVADGNTLTLWVNGEQVLSHTLETPGDTNIGFFYSKFNYTLLRDIWLEMVDGRGKSDSGSKTEGSASPPNRMSGTKKER